jgi:hypothetical protein
MSATVPVSVSTGQSLAHGVLLALVALAVVVLLAVSFAIGRATVGTSSKTSTIVPAASQQGNVDSCPRLRFC